MQNRREENGQGRQIIQRKFWDSTPFCHERLRWRPYIYDTISDWRLRCIKNWSRLTRRITNETNEQARTVHQRHSYHIFRREGNSNGERNSGNWSDNDIKNLRTGWCQLCLRREWCAMLKLWSFVRQFGQRSLQARTGDHSEWRDGSICGGTYTSSVNDGWIANNDKLLNDWDKVVYMVVGKMLE